MNSFAKSSLARLCPDAAGEYLESPIGDPVLFASSLSCGFLYL